MSAHIIDGRAIATDLKAAIKAQIEQHDLKVGLAAILVGDDPASHVYVGHKIKACEAVGIQSYEHKMPETATADEIRHTIKNLNMNPHVHGILLQLPLPQHLAAEQESLVQLIAPEKDVDGLTVTNAGKLFLGIEGGIIPCTPQGSLKLIQSVEKDLSGKDAIVIGRSNLFGKPMDQLLLKENCTITMAHSRTRDLTALCRNADILIAAVGQPKMVKADWVKEGAIVIDVGINRLPPEEGGKLCGDVDFDAVKDKARAITPVPGGVGPMTIACLLSNTVKAAQRS